MYFLFGNLLVLYVGLSQLARGVAIKPLDRIAAPTDVALLSKRFDNTSASTKLTTSAWQSSANVTALAFNPIENTTAQTNLTSSAPPFRNSTALADSATHPKQGLLVNETIAVTQKNETVNYASRLIFHKAADVFPNVTADLSEFDIHVIFHGLNHAKLAWLETIKPHTGKTVFDKARMMTELLYAKPFDHLNEDMVADVEALHAAVLETSNGLEKRDHDDDEDTGYSDMLSSLNPIYNAAHRLGGIHLDKRGKKEREDKLDAFVKASSPSDPWWSVLQSIGKVPYKRGNKESEDKLDAFVKASSPSDPWWSVLQSIGKVPYKRGNKEDDGDVVSNYAKIVPVSNPLYLVFQSLRKIPDEQGHTTNKEMHTDEKNHQSAKAKHVDGGLEKRANTACHVDASRGNLTLSKRRCDYETWTRTNHRWGVNWEICRRWFACNSGEICHPLVIPDKDPRAVCALVEEESCCMSWSEYMVTHKQMKETFAKCDQLYEPTREWASADAAMSCIGQGYRGQFGHVCFSNRAKHCK